MGNTVASYFSCIPLSGAASTNTNNNNKAASNNNKTATLLDTKGKVEKIKLPVKAGELMIQELGHVIIAVEEFLRTRRVSAALPADQELVAGKVYLLVPVSRVHTKATQLELEIVEKWWRVCCNCDNNNNKNKKKSSSSGKRYDNNMAKVSPVSKKGELLLDLEGSNNIIFSEKHSGGGVGEGVSSSCDQFMRRQARWNPVLEPILESSRDYSQHF